MLQLLMYAGCQNKWENIKTELVYQNAPHLQAFGLSLKCPQIQEMPLIHPLSSIYQNYVTCHLWLKKYFWKNQQQRLFPQITTQLLDNPQACRNEKSVHILMYERWAN